MAKIIQANYLAEALQQELDSYHKDIIKRVDDAGAKSIVELKNITKATAPVDTGNFKRNIAAKEQSGVLASGMKSYVWYVKSPEHRLTHLLVHGHATRNGGRTKADPFLVNALEKVLPAYEKAVEEAIKNGK